MLFEGRKCPDVKKFSSRNDENEMGTPNPFCQDYDSESKTGSGMMLDNKN